MDVSALAVALQRKYAGPFGILIMALIGMPLAVSFGRKGTVIALCAAVVVGAAYWALGGGFQQLGNHGLLRPSVAGWSPLVIFTAAGTYFLVRPLCEPGLAPIYDLVCILRCDTRVFRNSVMLRRPPRTARSFVSECGQ